MTDLTDLQKEKLLDFWEKKELIDLTLKLLCVDFNIDDKAGLKYDLNLLKNELKKEKINFLDYKISKLFKNWKLSFNQMVKKLYPENRLIKIFDIKNLNKIKNKFVYVSKLYHRENKESFYVGILKTGEI